MIIEYAPDSIAHLAGKVSERERIILAINLRIESLKMLPGKSAQSIIRELYQLQAVINAT